MRDVAAWLVARPQNAIPVLGITLLIPILQPLSGIVLVLLVLAQGSMAALRQAGIVAAILAVALMLSGMPWQSVVLTITITWLPLFLLAWSVSSTRSLTLTLQASVIVAALCGVATGVLIEDPVAFWKPWLDFWFEVFGRTVDDSSLVYSVEFASRFGALFVVSAWYFYSLIFLAGYLLFCRLKTDVENYGRIRDLNFGRVLASGLVLTVLLSAATNSALFDLAGIVMIGCFLLQGWALMYWVFAAKGWPMGAFFAVCVVSVVFGLLSVILMMVGYLDAWFDFRRRMAKT